MVGSKAEKDHRRRVGKNWVMMGFWGGGNRRILRALKTPDLTKEISLV